MHSSPIREMPALCVQPAIKGVVSISLLAFFFPFTIFILFRFPLWLFVSLGTSSSVQWKQMGRVEIIEKCGWVLKGWSIGLAWEGVVRNTHALGLAGSPVFFFPKSVSQAWPLMHDTVVSLVLWRDCRTSKCMLIFFFHYPLKSSNGDRSKVDLTASTQKSRLQRIKRRRKDTLAFATWQGPAEVSLDRSKAASRR